MNDESMTVLLNGSFLSEAEASISVNDRGFLYGDGLFETVRIYNGKPFCWDRHWRRLYRSARFLDIPIPFTETEMLRLGTQLVNRNDCTEAMLRITLTRGPGPRGYSPRGASTPTLLMSVKPFAAHPQTMSQGWRLITSPYRVDRNDPLIRHKTCNRLLNVIARHEAERNGADDALLLNREGEVTETTSANVFWIQGETIGTPPLDAGLLPGITREVLIELCGELSLTLLEESVTLEDINRAEAVLLTLSSWELANVASIDGHHFAGSALVDRLREAYRGKVRRACGRPTLSDTNKGL